MTAKLDPDHQVAVWAVRYCLGRMTNASWSCVEWLIWAWPDLSEEVRGIIKRDIEEAFAEDDRDRARLNGASGYKRLGMDMDRREWERVRRLWGSP
jgi:hypothetical protein